MPNWVYIRSEPGLYTVGFFEPDGKWHPESDFNDQGEAAERVHYLNGGAPARQSAPGSQHTLPENCSND